MEQAGEMSDTEVMPLCYTFRPRSAPGGAGRQLQRGFLFLIALC